MLAISRAAAALAALALSVSLARGDDLKVALIYGRTGPLEAYAKQTEIGLSMGLEYATKGTMKVAGRKIVVIAKDDQGKPDLAKSALTEAYEDDAADIAIGTTSSPATIAMLPVAEEHKKILIVEPRGRRPDHRREMEPLYLPHRAQLLAGRDLQRGRNRRQGRDDRRARGRQRVRPRRRRRLQGRAGQNRRDAGGRGIRAHLHHRFHRRRPAPVRRPQGQARQEADLVRLGGRLQPAGEARRHGPEPLRHRLCGGGQHPARAGRLQALPRPRRRDVLLLRHPEKPDQRLVRRRAPEALQRAARLLHLRRVRRRDGARRLGGEDGGLDRCGKADPSDGGAVVSKRRRAR